MHEFFEYVGIGTCLVSGGFFLAMFVIGAITVIHAMVKWLQRKLLK